jgi:hypothetical protein
MEDPSCSENHVSKIIVSISPAAEKNSGKKPD